MAIKALLAPLVAGVASLVAIPLLLAGGDTEPPQDGCELAPSDVGGDPASIVATIRDRESGGDYQARATGSTASGAYQFTDATWAGYRGYPRAWLAPPAVQDAKAAAHITGILAANNDDIAAVPVTWYLGYVPAPDDTAWDRVPNPEAGNRLTPRQYQAAWLRDYAEHARDAGPASAPTCGHDDAQIVVDAAAPSGLTTVEGITVDAQIASQVQGLVRAARAHGYELTGSGYRRPERQVELRRQNCGTSHYAIYEMPSSQCSPPTARPGTSMHERGLAIDFSCDGALVRSSAGACSQWLADHAGTYGLRPLASEPWHYSVNGS